MPYALLADLALLLHAAFVLFVMAGGLLVLQWPKIAWLHLPAVGWAVWIEFSGSICPLTPLEQSLLEQSLLEQSLLEQSLLERAGEVSYDGSFIGHYLEPILYPVGLTAETQWWLGGIVIVINMLAYTWVWKRWRQKNRRYFSS